MNYPKAYVKQMDWARVWHRQLNAASFRGEGGAYWDNWARSVPDKGHDSVYVKEVLKRLHLEPGWSVLDVGAGMGALAVPLAKQGYAVTAVDHSPAMLKVLAAKAARQKLNIHTIELDWARARIGTDFDPHDVVLVSRSLPSGDDIVNCLRLIARAARHACYITWKAASTNRLEMGLCDLLGIPYAPLPEYTVLYNLLYSLGIYASVEIFYIDGLARYHSLEDAFFQLMRSRVVDSDTQARVMSYLAANLLYHEGVYCHEKGTAWALIYWDK